MGARPWINLKGQEGSGKPKFGPSLPLAKGKPWGLIFKHISGPQPLLLILNTELDS